MRSAWSSGFSLLVSVHSPLEETDRLKPELHALPPVEKFHFVPREVEATIVTTGKSQMVNRMSTRGLIFLIGLTGLLILLVSCNRYLDKEGLQKHLSDAAWSGDVHQMERLINLGAEINKTCCGRNPALHEAAGRGQVEAARFLIAHGADVNLHYKFNSTPLMEAVRNERTEVVRLLLQHGANPNAVEAMEHQSVLDYARGNAEITALLKEYGAMDRTLNK